jgi:hypothetical protein
VEHQVEQPAVLPPERLFAQIEDRDGLARVLAIGHGQHAPLALAHEPPPRSARGITANTGFCRRTCGR